MKKKYTSNLSKRLGQYGSLAVALTGLSEANSQVVYTDVNPDYSGGIGSTYAIDFNNDGITDINIENIQSSYFSSSGFLYAVPTGSNEVLGSGGGFLTYPFALSSGATISSGVSSFFDNSYTNSMNWGSFFGNWVGVTDKYLGVKFDISGQTHYGWIRLDVASNTTFVVKDYAYESTANGSILAGDLGVPVSCAIPTAVMVDVLTETTVNFSWTASADETDGYNWAIFAAGDDITTASPIVSSDVATGVLTAAAVGLAPGTSYDIYVQTKCNTISLSDWAGPLNFTTDAMSCETPTAVIVDNFTEDSVDFSWTASADETDGYNWAIFAAGDDITTATPVANGDVLTGVLTASATGLAPETSYDIYVQTKCSSSNLSDWEGPLNFSTEQLSIKDISSLSSLKFYPNPVQSNLNIVLEEEIKEIKIFNLLGQQILNYTVNSKHYNLNLENLENGAYFVEVSNNQNSKTIKIIKE